MTCPLPERLLLWNRSAAPDGPVPWSRLLGEFIGKPGGKVNRASRHAPDFREGYAEVLAGLPKTTTLVDRLPQGFSSPFHVAIGML